MLQLRAAQRFGSLALTLRHVPQAAMLARPANQQRQPQQRRQRSMLVTAALSPDALFGAATLAVMPCYALMVAAPRWRPTQKLLDSQFFVLGAAAFYVGLLVAWRDLLPQAWQVVQQAAQAALSQGALPDVAAFAALFSKPAVTALSWVHLMLLDLFQARWVWKDGLLADVPTAHSAILCFMVGPLGLLSHWVTKTFVFNARATRKKQRDQEYVTFRF